MARTPIHPGEILADELEEIDYTEATAMRARARKLYLRARGYATGHWALAAEAVLDLIHVDLESGDTVQAGPGRGQPDERVAVEDGALRIRTRSTGTGDARGSAIHRFILRSGTLRRQQRADDVDHRERPLLDEVSTWTCEIDEQERLLSIAISTHTGALVERSFRLP